MEESAAEGPSSEILPSVQQNQIRTAAAQYFHARSSSSTSASSMALSALEDVASTSSEWEKLSLAEGEDPQDAAAAAPLAAFLMLALDSQNVLVDRDREIDDGLLVEVPRPRGPLAVALAASTRARMVALRNSRPGRARVLAPATGSSSRSQPAAPAAAAVSAASRVAAATDSLTERVPQRNYGINPDPDSEAWVVVPAI